MYRVKGDGQDLPTVKSKLELMKKAPGLGRLLGALKHLKLQSGEIVPSDHSAVVTGRHQ